MNAINGIDRLAMRDSPVHRLHPMSKLLATVCFVVVVVSFPSRNVMGLLPLVLYPVILMYLSSTPYRPLMKRLALALPFSLAGGLSNLAFVRDTAVYVGGFALSGGAVAFVSIMLKTVLTVLAVLVMAATTPLAEIGSQLAALHAPEIFCLQLVMTYRYLSTLIGEAASMHTAYVLRAGKGLKMKDTGVFLGQLLLRSFDRAERVYQAMKCRGFQGVYRTKIRRLRPADGLLIALAAGMIVWRFVVG